MDDDRAHADHARRRPSPRTSSRSVRRRLPIALAMAVTAFAVPDVGAVPAGAPAPPSAGPLIAKVKIDAGGVVRLHAADYAGVGSDVAAVSMNLAVTEPDSAGFITVYPCGDRPLAASLNYLARETVANSVIAPVSPTGDVCFYSSASVHLVADVTGWFPAAAGYRAVTPTRLFDTRPGEPVGVRDVSRAKVGDGNVLRVKVTDLVGVVPVDGVVAVVMNVAVTQPDGPGFVTVYPCGERPLAANLNFVAGQTIPNMVVASVSTEGEVCFFSSSPTHLVADVNGWFAGGGDAGASVFTAFRPVRLFDTRPGVPAGLRPVPADKIGGGAELRVKVTGMAGLTPTTGVGAVAMNVAVTEPDRSGFVTVYPCGARPLAASLNFVAGQTIPNMVIAPVSAEGEVCFYSSSPTHLVVDVSGWFGADTGFRPLAPLRLFDTRPGSIDQQMDLRIDPLLDAQPAAVARAIDALFKMAVASGLERRKVIVFYSPTAAGVTFASRQLDESGCMAGFDPAGLAAGMGVGSVDQGCGLAQKLGDWSFPQRFIILESMVAHEGFHVYQGQILRACGCPNQRYYAKAPRWMLEGTADIAGFESAYGIGSPTMTALRRANLALGRDSSADVSLPQLDQALFDGGIGVDIRYSRAMLAAQYLLEITSRQKVMRDFWDNVVAMADWESAFTATFGFTEAQFDQMFRLWLAGQP